MVNMEWNTGDTCYFITSNQFVVPGKVWKISGDFILIKYGNENGIRLRKSKVYKTEAEAKELIRKMRSKTQYDYM